MRICLGFDDLKEELGDSRGSSMQRGESLDVSYDEEDLIKVGCVSVALDHLLHRVCGWHGCLHWLLNVCLSHFLLLTRVVDCVIVGRYIVGGETDTWFWKLKGIEAFSWSSDTVVQWSDR